MIFVLDCRYALDEDKYWPGYMLNRLVLYEPGSNGHWKGIHYYLLFSYASLSNETLNRGPWRFS